MFNAQQKLTKISNFISSQPWRQLFAEILCENKRIDRINIEHMLGWANRKTAYSYANFNRNEGGNMNWSYLPATLRPNSSVICSIWMKLIFDLNEFKWTNRRWLISITLINSESTQQCQRTRAISIAATTSMLNKLKLMLSQNNRPWTNALMVSRIPTQIRLTMETFAIFCVCLRLR